MAYAIFSALLPISFVVALGWIAGRMKIFPDTAVGTLAKLVISFALPLALFLAAAKSDPSTFESWRYVAALIVGIAGTFVIGFAVSRLAFGHDTRTAAIQAQACSFPDMAYCGPPVLIAVVGPSGILAVAIGNLVTSLITLPATLVLLRAGRPAEGEPEPAGKTARGGRVLAESLVGAVKAPLVWLPVAGFLVALSGYDLPDLAVTTAGEIGNAAGGVALFMLGLMIQKIAFRPTREVVANIAIKNFVQPILALGFALAIGLNGPLLQQVFLIAILPAATVVPALAHTGNTYEERASLSVVGSTLVAAVTIGIGIAIAEVLP